MKLAGYLLLVLLAPALLLPLAYAGLAYALMAVPANRDWRPLADGVDAYLASNGVHVDFVFPVRHAGVDWTTVFPLEHFPLLRGEIRYIAIGWGDREFYLHTPRWRDLTAGTALRALSGSNDALLHVSYLSDMSQVYQYHGLAVSDGEYANLVDFVRATIDLDADGPKPVAGFRYAANDAFFAAEGAYKWWYTCNSWIGEGLREAGVKASIWTPFADNVFHPRSAH